MNNRRLLIAAVFHFMHPVEKDIYVYLRCTYSKHLQYNTGVLYVCKCEVSSEIALYNFF